MSLFVTLSRTPMRRTLVAAATMGGYALLAAVLFRQGMLLPSVPAAGLVFSLLGLGAALLAAAVLADLNLSERWGIQSHAVTTLLVVWGLLAAVMTAFFVPWPLQALLLLASLLGLCGAALHYRRQIIYRMALLVWLASGALWLTGWYLAPAALPHEAALILALFTVSLAATVVVAGEVASLRTALSRRTRDLEEAMEMLSEAAMRDELTGLYNRRQLMEQLKRHKALADRGSLTFSLCFLDLDHFKDVNDRFGHSCGDDVLKAFAEVAMRVIREEDFAARFGGEEFVLVLVNASPQVALSVAERLRRQTQMLLVHPSAPDYMITVSAGIAEYTAPESLDALLARADMAMYEAKQAGRNQVRLAQSSVAVRATPASNGAEPGGG